MQLAISIKKGTLSGLRVLWELAKVIVPAVTIIHVLDRSGWLAHVSTALGPAMHWFGLPGEGALALVSANMLSVYAGIGTMSALHLTWKQITILSTMIMICHAAIQETALVSKAGARGSWVLGLRFVTMVITGLLLNVVLR